MSTPIPPAPRILAIASLVLLAGIVAAGCGKKSSAPVDLNATRTFRMGFTAIPPRADLSDQLTTLSLQSTRVDAALMLFEPPWDSLLAGVRADSLVIRHQKDLADYYRGLGLTIVVSLDPTDGLDRSKDSKPLVAAGRSLTEASIRQLYRNYAVALDTIVKPAYFSVASETNLIRAIAPIPLYAALIANAAAAADTLRKVDASVKIFATVQVEVAWGRLVPSIGYVGITQDLSDFSFTEAIGLSSYPYLGGWADPNDLPDDYFSKLRTGTTLPALMVEGGWTSADVAGVTSTPDKQRRYIAREANLLRAARAVAWFQITFTDLDLAAFPAGIEPFAYLGLVDKDFNPKPALSAWDAEFAKPKP